MFTQVSFLDRVSSITATRVFTVVMLVVLIAGLVGCSSSATPTLASPTSSSPTQPVATRASVTPSASATQSAAAAPTTAAALPARGGSGGMAGSLMSVTPTYKDVAYAAVSAAQKLDLYIPQGTGPFALVIMVHGGGFMMGDKADGAGLGGGDKILAQGYAIASLNYRLAAEAKFPAQIQDVKAAVRFLRANAQKFNLNPDKFAAFGASAGGNLVSLLGTSCGVAELEGAELGNAGQSSCVQAVVDWFGPIDFLKMDEQFTGTSCPVNHNDASSPESQVLGAAIQSVPEKAKAANPMTYINAKAPAFLIQHGTADCNIPPVQGQLLADALTQAIGKDKVTLTFIDGAGHGGSQFTTEANLKIVTDFLAKYLK